jgi:hypothetical protein
MAVVPQSLLQLCAQRPLAHELWTHLYSLFATQSLTSLPLLAAKLFTLRLSQYDGVSSFLTDITTLAQDLRSGGGTVEEFMLAGAILIGMEDRYPMTRETLLALPRADQTMAVFGARLLEAEKNAGLMAEYEGEKALAGAKATSRAPPGPALAGEGCGYVRKLQAKYPNQKPGQVCKGVHSRAKCWMRMADEWLQTHPGQVAAELPDFRTLTQRGGHPTATAASSAMAAPPEENCSGMAAAVSVQPPVTDALATTLILDSGASVPCFKEARNVRPMKKAVNVNGAGEGMSVKATESSAVPCPVLPEGELRGVHSTQFRYNLVGVHALQQKGVHVAFPPYENRAVCTGQNGSSWVFPHDPSSGLYSTTLAAAIGAPESGEEALSTDVSAPSLAHPTVLLHHKLGHLSEGYLKTLIQQQAAVGLPKSYTQPPMPLQACCEPCIMSKAQAKPHPPNPTRKAKPLERVHMDLVGPMPMSQRGHKWWITIVDDYSRFGWSLPVKSKGDVPQRLKEWYKQVTVASELPIKECHADRGGEFMQGAMQEWMAAQGTVFTYSNPDSPEQNGVAEARNKTVQRIMRTLLFHADAPRSLWNYAVAHATLLNNLWPHTLLSGRTPSELWHGQIPSLQRLKVWGCTAHALLNPKERRVAGGKVGPRTKACIYVGSNPAGAGYLLLDGATFREVPSSDVVFQEHLSYFRRRTDRPEEPSVGWDWFDADPPAPVPAGAAPPPAGPLPPAPVDPVAPEAPDLPPCAPVPPREEDVGDEGGRLPAPPLVEDPPAPASPRRSNRLRGIEPDNLPPSNIRWNRAEGHPAASDMAPTVHALVQTIALGESGVKQEEVPTPNTWQEALNGKHGGEWLESMGAEYEGLQQKGTFELVPRSCAKNVIKSKWVYRVKRRKDGTAQFKSRLVAKGFSQKPGVDYFATWAPTARLTTARVLLHLAAVRDMEIHVMDVDQAFLQGDLEEELYMELPPVLPAGPRDGSVWRLRKPLYGLKQAPRQWQAKLRSVLEEMGFKRCSSDPSLYLRVDSSGVWLLVYVDDLLLASKDTTALQQVKEELKARFPMKDLGPIHTYLGMTVTRDREKRQISLSQAPYLKELATKFPVPTGGRAVTTPLPQHHNLNLPLSEEEVNPEQQRYPELVGSLMWAAVCTRPDIAHSLSVLTRFMADGRHGATHWAMALRVLAYLTQTADRCLVLGGSGEQLQGWGDASWADQQEGRRSSQGYCFALGTGVISWKAGRSPSVALSSCEAELYAGTAAAQESLWLTHLLEELGVQQELPTLWCDNEATILQTEDPVYSARMKHIEARYFFLRELSQAGKLVVRHIPSAENLADVFTKALGVCDHARHTESLGVRAPPSQGVCCA